MAEPTQVYRCDHCGRVVAELREGKLVLLQRHGDEQHMTIITLVKSPNQ
jgi:desulfoferrodoxin-like iron-binding protein